MAQPTVPPAAEPVEEADIAPQQPEQRPEGVQAPAGAPAVVQQTAAAQRLNLQALLDGSVNVDTISDAAEATRLGIEARGRGNHELAEKLYLRSMGLDDGAANFIANFANLADLARLRGDFRTAHNLATTGRGRAIIYAGAHSIDLSTDDGVGFDSDPEKTAELREFWFALAKVLNFEALTYRAEFDASGVGDKRNGELLGYSLEGNQRAFDISTNIGHGYRHKVLVDLLTDKIESNDPAEWQSAIDTVTPLLETGGLDPNREQNFRCICGIAQMRFGKNEEAIASFRTAYEVSSRAGLRRETANNLVRLAAALIETSGVGGTADSDVFDQLEACIDDLTEPDIGNQQASLQIINELYPLPGKFIRVAK